MYDLKINQFLSGLREVGAGDGSDFSVSIFTQGNQIFSSKFSDSSQCTRKYDVKRDLVSVSIQKQLVINQDTKFMFHCSTSGVPVGYDDCAFFFWLHTYFIENNRILLSREQLDNPHKQKTWAVWKENFFVEVSFGKPWNGNLFSDFSLHFIWDCKTNVKKELKSCNKILLSRISKKQCTIF